MSASESRASGAAKPPRILACTLCQQRKIKCDRRFPCATCVKNGTQCVPAGLISRPRRRRFPERELLDRLRHYEDVLRQNNINFEPLHSADKEKTRSKTGANHQSSEEAERDLNTDDNLDNVTIKSESDFEVKEFWNVMNHNSPDNEDDDNDDYDNDSGSRDSSPEGLRPAVVQRYWDRTYAGNDHLFSFGLGTPEVDLASLHPPQVQIFRIWQIYQDFVNPLLKVTHIPTLQTRILNAIGDMSNIPPSLEVLLFSIYCISIHSLPEGECLALFGSPAKDVLPGYQFGYQQALAKSAFLRSNDIDLLISIYFYFVDPRSMSTMSAIIMRRALKLGINSETFNAKYPILEAEMRRRLWWSLVMFDNRACQVDSPSASNLVPTWDCKLPLNVNDSDLLPEMKSPPTVYGNVSEAIFAVTRSEMGNFIRRSPSHLDFLNPFLKPLVKSQHRHPNGDDLVAFEEAMEDKYLKFCNPENPLQFMTICTAKIEMGKHRLIQHYAEVARTTFPHTASQLDSGVAIAIDVLEWDTRLTLSPLTRGFFWYMEAYFPFPAYIRVVQYLRMQPMGQFAERAWKVMPENYNARILSRRQGDNPFVKVFGKTVVQAWAARSEAVTRSGGQLEAKPVLVSDIEQRASLRSSTEPSQPSPTAQQAPMQGMFFDNLMDIPHDNINFGDQSGFNFGGLVASPPNTYDPNEINLLNWNAMDWNPIAKGEGW